MALNRQIYIRGVQKDLPRASRWQRLPLNFSRAWQTGAWPTSEINGQRMELLMLMLWKNMPNAQQNYQILDQTKFQNINQNPQILTTFQKINHTLPLEFGLFFSFKMTTINHPILNEVSHWKLLLLIDWPEPVSDTEFVKSFTPIKFPIFQLYPRKTRK